MAAIQTILKLDEAQLEEVVRKKRISMCGAAPTIATLSCCKHLGAQKAELIKYQTSGDVTGEYDQVVGYAALIVL
jgi:hypothetical protein